jgi:hypothetical protein
MLSLSFGPPSSISVDGSKWPVKQLRENDRWLVSIIPTLVWGNVSDQYVGLVATVN